MEVGIIPLFDRPDKSFCEVRIVIRKIDKSVEKSERAKYSHAICIKFRYLEGCQNKHRLDASHYFHDQRLQKPILSINPTILRDLEIGLSLCTRVVHNFDCYLFCFKDILLDTPPPPPARV